MAHSRRPTSLRPRWTAPPSHGRGRFCGSSTTGDQHPSPSGQQTSPWGYQGCHSRTRLGLTQCGWMLTQLQKHAEGGGASVRENLHWYLPQEQAMMESGLWKDTQYSACVFAGARSKLQCLRHNVQEIEEWPPLMCHHTHHPREWEPQESSDGRWYPSKAEAEYTAALAFTVAASWWAARVGRARLTVPRMPAIETVRWTGSTRMGHGTDGGEPRAQAAPAGIGRHGALASGDP